MGDVTRKRITGNGPTQATAKQRLEKNFNRYISPKAQDERKSGGRKRRTVQQLFDEWSAANWAGAVSPTMAQKYDQFFNNHLLDYIGPMQLNDLDEDTLYILFNQTLHKKRRTMKDGSDGGQLLSTAATRNIYMALQGALSFAVRKDYLRHSPLKGVEAPARQVPDDDVEGASEDARRLLKELASEGSPDYCRWLFQFLALRKSERLGLSWKNIRGLDGDATVMIVSQQLARYVDGRGWYIKPWAKQKEGKKPRRVPIPPEPFARVLREHRAAQDELKKSGDWNPEPQFADLVFLQDNGKIITPNRDNNEWHALLAAHGIDAYRPHLNRHICATWLAEMDPPMPIGMVREILGHASEAMSWYYTKTTLRQMTKPLTAYGKMIAGDPDDIQ